MSIIVCGPPRSIPAWRHLGACPLCERRRRLVTTYDGIYYGTTTHCYGCLGREQDGDWRPHSGRYATEDRAYVSRLWAAGVDLQKFDAAVREFQRDYWEME